MLNAPGATTSSHVSRRCIFAAMVAILVLFVAVSALLSIHRAPWLDEGIFADSASNLALRGVLGSTAWHTYIPGLVPDLPAIDRYTYWHMPLYAVSVAGVFRIFGFSILAMRAWSIWWGCVLIVSWYFVVRDLAGGNRLAGLLAAVFVGTDATITLAAVTGRPDCMVAALGAAGLASYLRLRQSRLSLAVLACASFQVAAVFTHPIGAVHAGTAVVMALVLDWRRLRLSHLFVAAVPPLIALLGWGVYIAQAPHVFQAQFFGHISHRTSSLTSPLNGLATEIQGRYIGYYWTQYHGITRLKALFLVAYAASCVFLLVVPAVRRRQRGLWLLGVLAVSACVLLALLDTVREPHYLIHTFSYLAAGFGGAVWWLVNEAGPRKIWVVTGAIALAALQLSGTAYKIHQDTNVRYRQIVEYVRGHSRTDSFIVGPIELIFGLGRQYHLEDDARLGAKVARAPDMIVRGPLSLDPAKVQTDEPQTAQFIQERLTREYTMVFDNEDYRVYLPAANVR